MEGRSGEASRANNTADDSIITPYMSLSDTLPRDLSSRDLPSVFAATTIPTLSTNRPWSFCNNDTDPNSDTKVMTAALQILIKVFALVSIYWACTQQYHGQICLHPHILRNAIDVPLSVECGLWKPIVNATVATIRLRGGPNLAIIEHQQSDEYSRTTPVLTFEGGWAVVNTWAHIVVVIWLFLLMVLLQTERQLILPGVVWIFWVVAISSSILLDVVTLFDWKRSTCEYLRQEMLEVYHREIRARTSSNTTVLMDDVRCGYMEYQIFVIFLGGEMAMVLLLVALRRQHFEYIATGPLHEPFLNKEAHSQQPQYEPTKEHCREYLVREDVVKMASFRKL